MRSSELSFEPAAEAAQPDATSGSRAACPSYVGAIAVDQHNADIFAFESLRERSGPGMRPHDQRALWAPLGEF